MQLTAHLKLSDFDQPEGYGCQAAEYPGEWALERAMTLAGILEAVCSELGEEEFTITSGYRTSEFNDALRNAGYPVIKDSEHCTGRAVDVIFHRARPIEVWTVALGLHVRGAIRLGGLGLYAGWVHLDIREGPLVQWLGPGSIF
jgi:uncharacterized protein YcbK (DUF882 family)